MSLSYCQFGWKSAQPPSTEPTAPSPPAAEPELAIEKAGAKVVAQYWTIGSHDGAFDDVDVEDGGRVWSDPDLDVGEFAGGEEALDGLLDARSVHHLAHSDLRETLNSLGGIARVPPHDDAVDGDRQGLFLPQQWSDPRRRERGEGHQPNCDSAKFHLADVCDAARKTRDSESFASSTTISSPGANSAIRIFSESASSMYL